LAVASFGELDGGEFVVDENRLRDAFKSVRRPFVVGEQDQFDRPLVECRCRSFGSGFREKEKVSFSSASEPSAVDETKEFCQGEKLDDLASLRRGNTRRCAEPHCSSAWMVCRVSGSVDAATKVLRTNFAKTNKPFLFEER
jgi:hypothetical protein